MIALRKSVESKAEAQTIIGVILMREPLLCESALLSMELLFTDLAKSESIESRSANAFAVVVPISKGGEDIHLLYCSAISFKSITFFSLLLLFWRPQIMQRASSLSSVTYPGPTLCGPPPFIFIHSTIYSSDISFSNSRYDPQESPTKVPNMHPWAYSLKSESSTMFSWFSASATVFSISDKWFTSGSLASSSADSGSSTTSGACYSAICSAAFSFGCYSSGSSPGYESSFIDLLSESESESEEESEPC